MVDREKESTIGRERERVGDRWVCENMEWMVMVFLLLQVHTQTNRLDH